MSWGTCLDVFTFMNQEYRCIAYLETVWCDSHVRLCNSVYSVVISTHELVWKLECRAFMHYYYFLKMCCFFFSWVMWGCKFAYCTYNLTVIKFKSRYWMFWISDACKFKGGLIVSLHGLFVETDVRYRRGHQVPRDHRGWTSQTGRPHGPPAGGHREVGEMPDVCRWAVLWLKPRWSWPCYKSRMNPGTCLTLNIVLIR